MSFHSEISFLVIVIALCLADKVLAASSERKTKAPSTVPIRGSKDLELNCPSISYTFPPGTLRCESCRAVAAMITYLVDAKFKDPLEATEYVCDTLEEESVLKQRRSGLRYWYHEGMAKYYTDHDPEEQRRKKIFVDDNYDETLVTYHTKEERESLPCAHHFLKKYCGQLLETNGDAVDACITRFTDATRGRKKKSGKIVDGAKEVVSTGEQDDDGTRHLRRDAALEDLQFCLVRSACSHVDCEARLLAKSERDERIRFMKYQAVYGTEKFQYVADIDDENKLQPNPYAKGGPKARENEYLRMRRDEL